MEETYQLPARFSEGAADSLPSPRRHGHNYHIKNNTVADILRNISSNKCSLRTVAMKVHQKLLFPAKLIKAQYNETLENIAVIVIFLCSPNSGTGKIYD